MTDVDERAARVQGIRDLADWLDEHPEMHTYGQFKWHICDPDQFDRLAAAMGATPVEHANGYDVAEIQFGTVTYGIQTTSDAQRTLARREAAIAAREAELGITPRDRPPA